MLEQREDNAEYNYQIIDSLIRRLFISWRVHFTIKSTTVWVGGDEIII